MAGKQLDLFEDHKVAATITVFTGVLNDIDNGSQFFTYGEDVELVIKGRVRRVQHGMDRSEETTRRQTILIDKIVEVR